MWFNTFPGKFLLDATSEIKMGKVTVSFPEGLKKNQRLPEVVITPTTKEKEHDRPITPEEVIDEGWLTEKEWVFARDKSLALYHYGVQVASQHGLVLVDTKYEFGFKLLITLYILFVSV